MASRDVLFTPWLKCLILAWAHGTLEIGKKESGLNRWFFACVLHLCVLERACSLLSEQLVSVPLVGVLLCHLGFFETAFPIHWVRDGAPPCTATLERSALCDRRSDVFGPTSAAQHLQTMNRKIKERFIATKMTSNIPDGTSNSTKSVNRTQRLGWSQVV